MVEGESRGGVGFSGLDAVCGIGYVPVNAWTSTRVYNHMANPGLTWVDIPLGPSVEWTDI